MSNQSEKSFATQLLDEKPQLRASLAASDLCKMYTSERGLRKITIDDVKYYVVEGDISCNSFSDCQASLLCSRSV